jgi:S-adenosyl-L-methionine hydrolase (adenosine-forming)
MRPLITLLTDFGTADGYVAEVKGVILTAAPEAEIVDVSHELGAHDIEQARLTLARYWRRFPRGTVHLAIVDPGVGSSRRALAVESDGRSLLGPDNGVLSPALLAAGARAVELPVPAHAAPTFHGRDVFAPAAARLAIGHPVDALGAAVDSPVIRRTPEPRRLADGTVQGEVIAIDRFGNAVTNLIAAHGGVVEVGTLQLPVRRTYADVTPGMPLALSGSSGLVEIAVRDGNAAASLGLGRGGIVLLRPARH